MLTYATCLHRPAVYERVCLPALCAQADRYGAEILTDADEHGISRAYERLRQRASFPTVCYLHDDLELLDPDATERIVRAMDDSGAGLLGVAGSAGGETAIPWWEAARFVGAWVQPTTAAGSDLILSIGDARARMSWKGVGHRGHRKPWEPAGLLDGILLADRTGLPWEPRDSFHGYDVDRSMQAHAAGFGVVVGDVLVRHWNQPHTKEWRSSMQPTWEEMRDKWTQQSETAS